jgi:hypothetical protein
MSLQRNDTKNGTTKDNKHEKSRLQKDLFNIKSDAEKYHIGLH